MNHMSTIQGRIKELRKQRKLTQDGAAFMFSVDKSTWSRIESGHREPSIQLIAQICRKWNISSDYLLFGENNNESQLDLNGLTFLQISAIQEIVKGLRRS